MLNAVSNTLRKVDIDPMDRARIDQSVATLVDLTGACERVFKSPVPLVYTRHTSRFLTFFLLCMPFGIWGVMGDSWNHWLTIPVSAVLSFFLLGIEEIGIQIEEPFSILPLEALCDGAIAATINELVQSKRDRAFDGLPALSAGTTGTDHPVVSIFSDPTVLRWLADSTATTNGYRPASAQGQA
jgi:predicted membrane chloride channel (bestrophin family)